ncbi:hypothetical protein HOS33_gp068 [Erwinia phage vB_EamM_Y3]|uniref:Uncharacterized protein n=1 Tax=Erwinia phage vB_EamM_Y3 TaxID=1983553 RepID=A0A2H4IAY5_9CAUD|nr:hypothetical protein HOS33_gp068 [Erwinia phage vB_EamM_Y3]ARW58708.1 hypothetical protein Y3_068 [Erwinia phage vB_EamM_Y3]
MAAIQLLFYPDVKDEKLFVEQRFGRSILFMHGISPMSVYRADSRPLEFRLYQVNGSKTYTMDKGPRNKDIEQLLNLKLVKQWTLVRRNNRIFYVGECSEAIIADTIPLGTQVEGEEDARRCFKSTNPL